MGGQRQMLAVRNGQGAGATVTSWRMEQPATAASRRPLHQEHTHRSGDHGHHHHHHHHHDDETANNAQTRARVASDGSATGGSGYDFAGSYPVSHYHNTVDEACAGPTEHQRGPVAEHAGGHQHHHHRCVESVLVSVEGTYPVVDPIARTKYWLYPSEVDEVTTGWSRHVDGSRGGDVSPFPSVCLLYVAGRCHGGQGCRQVHVAAEAIHEWREGFQGGSTCCGHHGDVASQEPEYVQKLKRCLPEGIVSIQVEGARGGGEAMEVPMPVDRLGRTRLVEQLVKHHTGFYVPLRRICTQHLQNKCSYGADCRHVHLCREWYPRLLQLSGSGRGRGGEETETHVAPTHHQEAAAYQYRSPMEEEVRVALGAEGHQSPQHQQHGREGSEEAVAVPLFYEVEEGEEGGVACNVAVRAALGSNTPSAARVTWPFDVGHAWAPPVSSVPATASASPPSPPSKRDIQDAVNDKHQVGAPKYPRGVGVEPRRRRYTLPGASGLPVSHTLGPHTGTVVPFAAGRGRPVGA